MDLVVDEEQAFSLEDVLDLGDMLVILGYGHIYEVSEV